MSETMEEKKALTWRVGQRRKTRINDLPGRPEVVVDVIGLYGFDDYDWRCRVVSGDRVGVEYGFDESWGSTLVADAPEAQPEKPMRSGPGVVPVAGMVIDFVRTASGEKLPSTPWTVVKVKTGEGSECLLSELPTPSWDNGQYDILSTPTQQPSPSHVCKAASCGKAWTASDKSQRNGFLDDGLKHWFCSPACRDAWKPEARAACKGNPCGKPGLTMKPDWVMAAIGGIGRIFCSPGCRDAAGEAAQRHRQPNSATPSPAPWRCAADDCRTPGAPRGYTNRGESIVCVVCTDARVARATPGAQKRTPQEPLATFFLPGSIPVSPHLEAMGGTVGSSWWPRGIEREED